MDHNLSFIEENYNNFIMDIYDYSTNIINELQQRFSNWSLFTSMKILNPYEWPKDSHELLYFENKELKNLLKYYKHLNFHNNIQLPALFVNNKCREEWVEFKIIITNSFSSNDMEVILPLLI